MAQRYDRDLGFTESVVQVEKSYELPKGKYENLTPFYYGTNVPFMIEIRRTRQKPA